MDDIKKQLLYTTTKIINKTINGEIKHSTGFLYNFKTKDKHIVRTIITCKHCIENYSELECNFCIDNGYSNPIDFLPFKLLFNSDTSHLIIKHDKYDLAAIIFSIDNKIFISGNTQPFYLSLENDQIPSQTSINNMSYIEDILMIGYPQGIYDDFNNKPIVRKGITATAIQLDFKNKPEFLIDIATFHGSSGSPVFYYSSPPYFEENAFVPGNPKLYLLGMFIGGWEEITNQPTKRKLITEDKSIDAKILLPNNIGFVLKSSVFEELNDVIYQRIKVINYK